MKFDTETTSGESPEEVLEPATLIRQAELERELGVNCEQVRQLLVELLQEHPREEIGRTLEGMLAQIPEEPPPEDIPMEEYTREYHIAADELKSEREQFMGLPDILKGLLMWVESPAERLLKNREKIHAQRTQVVRG